MVGDYEGVNETSGRIRYAVPRRDGSRQTFRRDRILPGSNARRDQADHRVRSLRRAAIAQGEGQFHAGGGVSFHAARAKRHWVSQPGQTDLNRASRWFSLPAEDRQRAAGETFGGTDRAQRLPRERSQFG